MKTNTIVSKLQEVASLEAYIGFRTTSVTTSARRTAGVSTRTRRLTVRTHSVHCFNGGWNLLEERQQRVLVFLETAVPLVIALVTLAAAVHVV